MNLYRIELSPDAAESFRRLGLLERQAVWDLLEDFRVGRIPEEDYGEMTQSGRLHSVTSLAVWGIFLLGENR